MFSFKIDSEFFQDFFQSKISPVISCQKDKNVCNPLGLYLYIDNCGVQDQIFRNGWWHGLVLQALFDDINGFGFEADRKIKGDRKIEINIWWNFEVKNLFLRLVSQNTSILTLLVTSLNQNWVKKSSDLYFMYQWWKKDENQ